MAAVIIETFSDLLADMSEKIGETTPNTRDDRKRKINSAIETIHLENLWWFDEKIDTSITTTTATDYALPDDFRAFHPKNPMKIGTNWKVQVPFDQLQQFQGQSGIVQLPQYASKNRFYVYGSRFYLLQTSQAAGSVVTCYYYKTPTALDATTDEPTIPVQYREAITLLAAGMYLKSQGGRESVEGNDYLQLYVGMIGKMKKEQDHRRGYGMNRRALDPEEYLAQER